MPTITYTLFNEGRGGVISSDGGRCQFTFKCFMAPVFDNTKVHDIIKVDDLYAYISDPDFSVDGSGLVHEALADQKKTCPVPCMQVSARASKVRVITCMALLR